MVDVTVLGLGGRSPWGGDTARRRFIGGGRGRFFHNSAYLLRRTASAPPPRTMCNVRPFNQLVPRLPTGDLFGPIYSERALRLFGKGTDARATASRTLAGRPGSRARPAGEAAPPTAGQWSAAGPMAASARHRKFATIDVSRSWSTWAHVRAPATGRASKELDR